MFLKVPPKFSIAVVAGFIKGRRDVLIHLAVFKEKKVSFFHFTKLLNTIRGEPYTPCCFI